MQLATNKWSQRNLWGNKKYRIVTIGKNSKNSMELNSMFRGINSILKIPVFYGFMTG
jgi:hypothetical protein